jgi:two-component system, chemotaxis family, response regulator Rcp1
MGSLRTIRLLVVEDDPAYLYLIRKAFSGRAEQTRWELTTAVDGQQAVHILFEEEMENIALPDLVLLDWKLPKVSGIEVLRKLKQHESLRRIPVLVFSTSSEQIDIHAAYDDHANGYITKPAGYDTLATIVESIERFWVEAARIPKAVR